MKEYFKKNLLDNPLVSKTLKLSFVSMFANLLGFLIPIYIAYNYKISKSTDDFFLSYSIIIYFVAMFSGAVRAVSIPFLKEKIDDKVKFDSFVSTTIYVILKYIGLACIMLSFVMISIYSYKQETLYWYILISIPIILFSIINAFFYGILNSLDKYYIAETSPFSRAVVIFMTILLLKNWIGMSAVIIGYNLGEIAKSFHLLYVLRNNNKINISFKNKNINIIRPFLKQGSYQILSTTIVTSTPLIDRVVASQLVVGSVSLLDYGDKVFMVFNTILSSFLVIILSKWAKEATENRFNIDSLNSIIKAVFTVTLTLLFIIYFTNEKIIDFIYPNILKPERETIAIILLFNMVGFIFNSMSQVINRATIAVKSTKIMIKTSTVRVISNVILDIVFCKLWGVVGITIATIGVHIIGLVMNYYLFSKDIKKVQLTVA